MNDPAGDENRHAGFFRVVRFLCMEISMEFLYNKIENWRAKAYQTEELSNIWYGFKYFERGFGYGID